MSRLLTPRVAKETPTAICRQRSLPKRCVRVLQSRLHSTGSFSKGRDVRILEVGARDGLQNIKQIVPTQTKLQLVHRLASCGFRDIEATSFVSPKWVPQLADGPRLMQEISDLVQQGSIRFPVLAPNEKGLDNAIASGAREVVVFASATEAFSKNNQNCSVDDALEQAQAVTEKALENNLAVRGVVSCIFADPYSGPTNPKDVVRVVQRLLDMGCFEVALGDTLGVGTPRDTQNLLEILFKTVPPEKLAGHFHDTYGQGVANAVKSYEMGLRSFDSSVAGLGGCPYARGAKGNVATEDLVYTFEKSGINTGVNLDSLVSTGAWISRKLGIPYGSRAGAALWAKQQSTVSPKPTVSSPTPRKFEIIEDTGEYRASRSGTVVQVCLTRARNGNALTDTMLDDLTALYRRLAEDRSVFHIVLSSEGKYFCTGMDLSGNTNTADGDGYYSKVVDLYRAIDEAPQTTIAMINGPSFGGGVGLGFVCDIRLASPEARWTLSEIKLGISPAIISKFLVREWGISFAREAMLRGREINPSELHRIGAVHEVSNNLEASLETCLEQLHKAAPRSATRCKELARLGWSNPEGGKQSKLIRETFLTMMSPGSEGRYGISQFQQKNKNIDWAKFWEGKDMTA